MSKEVKIVTGPAIVIENIVLSIDFSYSCNFTELDQLLDDAPLPFIMQHAAKIAGVRKRVSSLNALLKSIQRRIDNVDRMLSLGISHGGNTCSSMNKLLYECSFSFKLHTVQCDWMSSV